MTTTTPSLQELQDIAATLRQPRFHVHCGETHTPGPCRDGHTRPPNPPPTAYDRASLETILTYHQRTDTSGCICGWSVLGASHSEHVADAYEEFMRGAAS